MAQLIHKKWLFSILAVLVLVPSLAFAQGFQTGTLSAVVKDQSGAALPGVTVTVTSEERGTQRTGVTESNGVATFPVLPLGFYKVEANLAGFNTAIRTNNKVESEKNTEVAFTLALAAASEALDLMDLLAQERRKDGRSTPGLDIALHVGKVLYGNVGTDARLDFTVIGPAVNEAARIELLCKELDRNLLVSEAFAAAAGRSRDHLVSLGRHQLRGVREATELFTLAA